MQTPSGPTASDAEASAAAAPAPSSAPPDRSEPAPASTRPDPTTSGEPGPDPRAAAQALAREVGRAAESLEKALHALARSVKPLATPAGWDDPSAALEAAQALEKLAVPADLLGQARTLAAVVRQSVAEDDRRQRLSFTREIRAAAGAASLEFAVLTSEPPEFRVGPLTAVVDFARRTASVRYARLELEKVPARPAPIVEAVRKHLAQLDRADFVPERFFEQVLQAYQAHLARRGQPLGSRVDLVDLLGEVAFALQSPSFFTDPAREKFVGYRRVQFAYDLARLRRAGRLAHRGLRMALGAATGASTRQKADVLYLEDDGGHGQYYLSILFRSVEGEGAAPGTP